MRTAHRALALALGLGLACLIVASESEARTLRIRIADMTYQPDSVTAEIGDIIEWSNDDFVDHSATGPKGVFDVVIPAGKKASAKMTRAGHFPYLCRFHPTMTGAITVK